MEQEISHIDHDIAVLLRHMKFFFKSLLGTVPAGARTASEVAAAGVSVKKEQRTNLSASDKLKLAKSAREGGPDKFTFFESDGQVGGDFRAVYDLHMRLEALSKASCSTI